MSVTSELSRMAGTQTSVPLWPQHNSASTTRGTTSIPSSASLALDSLARSAVHDYAPPPSPAVAWQSAVVQSAAARSVARTPAAVLLAATMSSGASVSSKAGDTAAKLVEEAVGRGLARAILPSSLETGAGALPADTSSNVIAALHQELLAVEEAKVCICNFIPPLRIMEFTFSLNTFAESYGTAVRPRN
jgi:hypothetical protein